MKKDYYLLVVWGDVEPQLKGPFKTEEERDQAAKDERAEDPEMHNGLFPIELEKGNEVVIGCYSGGFFEE